MVLPLYDDNSDRTTTPFVNYAIIALNILVFVFLQGLGSNDQFTYSFSTVPAEILQATTSLLRRGQCRTWGSA